MRLTDEQMVRVILDLMEDRETQAAAEAVMEGSHRNPARAASRVLHVGLQAIHEHGQLKGLGIMSRLATRLDAISSRKSPA